MSKRLGQYSLKNKKKIIVKPKKKFDKVKFTKAMGNPYGVKYPKAKKTLIKVKKKHKKRKRIVKVIPVYR